jgi:hypothetical protein
MAHGSWKISGDFVEADTSEENGDATTGAMATPPNNAIAMSQRT